MWDNGLYCIKKPNPKRKELERQWRNHEISHREYNRRSAILYKKGL